MQHIVSSVLGRFFEEAPSVEGGNITCRNARIRKDVIGLLGLPLALSKGNVGNLSVEIASDGDWRRLHVKIEAKDVLLVVGPKETSDQGRAQLSREQILANLIDDTKNRVASLIQSAGDVSVLSWWSSALLVGRLLGKLTVSICGIHVRYNDADFNPSEPFSIGLCISEARLVDDDAATTTKDGKTMSNRRLDIEGVQVYSQTGSVDADATSVPPGAQDILRRTDLNAALSFATSDDGASELSSAHCETGALSLVLTPRIVRDLDSALAVLRHRNPRVLYVTRRPEGPPKGNAAAWWQYALSCVHEVVRRERIARTPEAMSVRIRDLVLYSQLYERHLQCALRAATAEDAGGAAAGEEAEEDRDRREDLEAGLPGVTLLAIRNHVQRRLEASALAAGEPRTEGGAEARARVVRRWGAVRWLQGWDRKEEGVLGRLVEAVERLVVGEGQGGGGGKEPQTGGAACRVSWAVGSAGVELRDAKRRNGVASGAESKVAGVELEGFGGSCSGDEGAVRVEVAVRSLEVQHCASPTPIEPRVLFRSRDGAAGSPLLRLECAVRAASRAGSVRVAVRGQLARMELVNSPPFQQVLLPFRAYVGQGSARSPPFFTVNHSQPSASSALPQWLRRARRMRGWDVDVDVLAHLPDVVVPANCEHRDRHSALLVWRPGSLALQTMAGAGGGGGAGAGVSVAVDDVCAVACARADDWRAALLEAKAGGVPELLLLQPFSISATVAPSTPGEELWSSAQAPVAVREVVLDGSKEKLARALECVVYAFANRAAENASSSAAGDASPLSLRRMLSGMASVSSLHLLSHLVSSSPGTAGAAAWSVSVEFERLLVQLTEQSGPGAASVARVEVCRLWAGAAWRGSSLGAKLRVQSVVVEDGQGTMHGSSSERVQLLSCSAAQQSEASKEEDASGASGSAWEGGGSDFLAVSLDIEPDEEDEHAARRISTSVRAGCTRFGVSLGAAARLQNFITSVVATSMPGAKTSVANRLRTAMPTKSGVMYSTRHATDLDAGSRSVLWSVSASLSSVIASILVPHSSFAACGGQVELVQDGALEQMVEVSKLDLADLHMQRQKTRKFVDDWSCKLGSLRLTGAREQCGDHTQLLQVPAAGSSEAVSQQPAISAGRRVRDARWNRPRGSAAEEVSAGDDAMPVGVHVRTAPFEGVVLMRLVTYIATSVTQSEMYISNSQRVLTAAVELAARARSKAREMLYNQAQEPLHIEVASGVLRMPCDFSGGADGVLLATEPLVVSNAAPGDGGESDTDVTCVTAKLAVETVLDGEQSRVFALASTARVERQLKLDRLDPAVPRVKVVLSVADVRAGVGQSQLGLLYRIVRWNSGQAEEARRAAALAVRGGQQGSAAEVGKPKPATEGAAAAARFGVGMGVGAARGGAEAGAAPLLDRRKVGIRVVDWVLEVESGGLTVSLREPAPEASEGEGEGGDGAAEGQPSGRPRELRDIVELRIGAISARMERWSDTASKGSLSMEGVRLTDVDPRSTNKLRNMLGPKDGSPFLQADLDSAGDGETHRVNVRCASQEANFSPGPLLRVATFLLSSSLVDASQLSEVSRPEMAVGESPTSLAMPRWRRRLLSLMMRPLEQDGVLDLHFQVAPCQVVVWEDTTKEDSAHTFLRFGVEATYLASLREHVTKISIGGVDAAVRTSERGGESHILSGLTAAYDASRKHDSSLEIKEKVSVSKLQLSVGYQDVKGVLQIARQWAKQARSSGILEAHGALQILHAAKRAAAAAASKVVEGIQSRAGVGGGGLGEGGQAKGAAPESPSVASERAGGSVEGAGAAGREMRPMEVGKREATPGFVELRRSHLVVTEQVRVCIVNDCVGFNVPLCEAILAPMSISTTSGAGGKGLHSKGQLRLEANFYNILSSAFEPVVEPIKLDVSSDLYVDATGAHNVSVSSKQRLEVNVSETHVCSLLSTVEAWSQDLFPHIKLEDAADLLRAKGSKVWPYTLRNETGCPLRFWAGRTPEPPEGSEVHEVAKEGEKPFAFAKTAGAGGGAAAMELHCVSVVVDGAAGPVTGVPVDTLGVHMFPLEDGQALIVEVSTGEGGGKVIAVQSVVKVCNHTDLEMEFAVITRQGNPVWLESLAPGRHFCLPTHLRECYAVLVRPVEDASASGFEWSERVLLPFRSQPSAVDWSLVTCSTTPDPQGLDPSRKCFQVRVDAKKPLSSDDAAAASLRAVLSVHPILRIANSLPVRARLAVLSADVQDRSEHVLFEKDVDPDKQLCLYSVDKKTALGLIVNIPGLHRVRQPALIYHPQPEGQELSARIELVDEWGASLWLGLEHETSPWGDVTVVVYALEEVHNHSGLSLLFGQEGWDAVGLPAPKLAAGQDPSAMAVQPKSMLESLLGASADVTRPREEGEASQEVAAGEAETAGRAGAPFVFSTEGEGISAGRMCVAVGGGDWSKPLSLEGAGSGGVVELTLPGGNAYGPRPLFELAVQVTAGARGPGRERVVALYPRFMVVNTTEHVLQIAQAGLEKYYPLGLGPRGRRVFHWGDATGQRCVRMRVCKEGGEEDAVLGKWGGAVTLDAEGSFAVRVPSLEGGFLNLKADVRVSGGSTRLFIAAESERHPSYLVRNDMPEGTVQVQQVGGAAEKALKVGAGQSAVLCWEEPLEAHHVEVRAEFGTVQVQMDDLGVAGWRMGEAQVTVSARGPTRILRVAPAREEEEGGEAGDAAAGGVPRGTALVRSSVAVQLGGVGVSLLDGGLEELVYLSLTQVKGQYTLGLDDASWEVKVGRLQVDNQTDVGAPVILHRVVRGETQTPMLHVSVVRQLDPSLKWFRYAAVSLQELRLALHETILVRLAGVVQSAVNASSLIRTPKDLKDATLLRWLKGRSAQAGFDLTPPKERRLYIEALHLHPVLLHVAFTPTGEIADRYHQRQQLQGGSGSTAANLVSFVRGLNMSFPSVEGTPLSLNGLILNRFFGASAELRACAWQHYKQHLKRQLYLTWAPGGSALANPSASISRVATDARDLFYDPAQALVRSPTDLKEALRSGGVHVTRSLHGGAVTFGQLSRSVSKALSQLAAEADGHPAQGRGEGPARSQAPNAQEAFAEGAMEFRRTVDEAAAGILKKPLQALESEGVGGFLAGLGKGLLGGVMKPTAGMLDLAAKTSDGFVNAANDTSAEFAGRVRPPRTMPLDGTLRAYDARAATGADVLRRVNAGAYRHELFVAYALLQGMEAVLVTDKRLVVVEVCTLEVRFKVRMSEIASARTQGSGVLVSVKSASSQGLKFYTEALGVSSPKPDRHLLCGDLDTAEWLVSSISACCQAAAAEDGR